MKLDEMNEVMEKRETPKPNVQHAANDEMIYAERRKKKSKF